MSSKLVAALGGGLWTVVLGDWDRGEDGDSETLEMLVEEVRLLGVEYSVYRISMYCTMCIMCIAHPICFPSTFCQIRGVRDTSVDALTLLNCSSVILRLTCALPRTAQIRS